MVVFFQVVLPIELSAWVSVVKNLPAKPETQVRSLGREDPLDEEIELLPGKSHVAWGATVHVVTESRTRLSG